ncbi:transposase family protein [Nostoc sp.]|uniref:transposase family protein n=1 Tax=Nostoc sp. TaxID=1180 RepID=UPI003FA54241
MASLTAQPSKTKNRTARKTLLGRPIVDDIGILERSRRRSASGEYRTYFHIGQSWGVNESTAYRIIRKIEETLVKSRVFTVPGKKRLFNSDYQLQVVIVDVTETPIERPKKNKKSSTVGRKNSIHSSHK